MIKFKTKKIVTSIIATLAISAISLNAADYGSVNGEEITKEDIAIALRNPNIDFEKLPKKSKNQVLDQIVEKKLLTEKAIKAGVSSDAKYKETLAKFEKELALEIWMQNEAKKIKVSDKELKDFYDKNKDKFNVPATLEARHILIKDEKEAKDIIKTLDKAKDKKEEFIKLAKEKSVGPSGPKGGYLGKFSENQMVAEFSKAASALKVGTYTKVPVKTQFGYHVIYLEGKEAPKTLTFDEVKGKINQVIFQEKFQDEIRAQAEELKTKAKIIIK
ncbi:peptidylprolyl isomerase [Halarcobacter ebronensis]|uniref:peptidylprolyl isomerase n=1 Tax=Halarcobacter ebronensis TaxID=1462615 RepID=UPI00155DA863|nr:peptidyl-prolyl cis-trans isomerase [Halarcobacter ebronensis]QKF81050.1 major antigenic peptide / PpiC-type peptidyl-prolyl cis-trans isomerase [Halarcobacter ebronensis]